MENAQEWAERVGHIMELSRSGTKKELQEAFAEYVKLLENNTLTEAILETCDSEKNCPIHVAALAGNVAALEWFEEQVGAEALVAVETRNGSTPLMLAVSGNKPEAVAQLLAWGADKYHMNTAKLTAIHLALSIADDTTVVDLLTETLEQHPNLYEPATVTGSLLTWCVLTNNIGLFKKIIEVSEPMQLAMDCQRSTLPCAVVASAHVETAGVVLHYLLQKAVAPDFIAQAHDQQGNSVLMNLAELDDPTLLMRLMEGCSEDCLQGLCNRRNAEGKTPFIAAATAEAQGALAKYTQPEFTVASYPVEPVEPAPVAHVGLPEGVTLECERLKVEANRLFGSKEYKSAELLFDQACELLELNSMTAERACGLSEELRALISTITANLSVTCLRLKDLDKAEHNANMAIEFAPDWYKGYYRLAMVKKAREDFAEAAQQMYQCVLRNSREESLQREFKSCLEKAKAQYAAEQAAA